MNNQWVFFYRKLQPIIQSYTTLMHWLSKNWYKINVLLESSGRQVKVITVNLSPLHWSLICIKKKKKTKKSIGERFFCFIIKLITNALKTCTCEIFSVCQRWVIYYQDLSEMRCEILVSGSCILHHMTCQSMKMLHHNVKILQKQSIFKNLIFVITSIS